MKKVAKEKPGSTGMEVQLYRMSQRGARAFTLIEMVVVVGILVLLSGLIVTNLDVFKLRANKGVAAADMGDLSRVIQQHYILHANYPDNWDSLLTSAGTMWTAPTYGQPGLDSELPGAPVPGSPHKLVEATFPAGGDGYMRSLSRIGITTLLDLDPNPAQFLPSDAFTQPRSIAIGGKYCTINTNDDDGQAIVTQYYPTTNGLSVIPSNKILLVVGVGPLNGIQGDDIQDVPFYPNRDISFEYARFLAVFEADAGGDPAHLRGVLGADGDTIVSETVEYYQH